MQKLCLSFILFLMLSITGFSQTSSVGNDFWFGYPAISDFPTDTMLKYTVKITSETTTTGNISIPGQGFSQNFSVAPGQITSIVLPSISVLDSSSEILKAVAIHVTSVDEISVFAFTLHPQRNCSMLISPIAAMGSDYYVLSNKDFTTGNSNNLSQFLIVAQGAAATVKITPTYVTRGGRPAGTPFTVTIPAGQVYQVQAQISSSVNGDLTGSRITAVNGTDLFAVIGGNQTAQIACSGTREYLASEMQPVTMWGQEYIFTPFPQQSGDICRILAAQNTTKVYINGVLKATLNTGAFYEQLITTASFICADKPVEVARYLQTAACNGNPSTNKPPGYGGSYTRGDPAMVVLQSNTQMYLNKVSFDATRADTIHYMVFGISFYSPIDTIITQIITRTIDKNTMFLNGVNIGSRFTTLAANTAYCYAAIGIPFATQNSGVYNSNTISTTGAGFLAYVTGEGGVSAYMHSVGFQNRFIPTATDSINISPASCYTVGTPVNLSAITSLIPVGWSWNFGDGTALSTSATPSHTYSTTGAKTITLTLTFACFTKTITYTINVCPLVVPVSLLEFSAKKEKSNVVVTWKTATENNNDYFEIESSTEGAGFNTISTRVKGAGNTGFHHNYTYTDYSARIQNPIIYYRLKQVDFDGKTSYSKVVFIENTENHFTVSINPSPVGDVLKLQLNQVLEGTISVRIYDVIGNQLMELDTNAKQGDNQFSFDVSALQAGIYLVSVNDNEQILQKKIVKL